jgi:hypothetical protein
MLKLYKIKAVPTLLYGCESWTLQKKHGIRIETGETKFLTSFAGHTVNDYTRNKAIMKEINIYIYKTLLWIRDLRG